jgi:hypothetical protein
MTVCQLDLQKERERQSKKADEEAVASKEAEDEVAVLRARRAGIRSLLALMVQKYKYWQKYLLRRQQRRRQC